jgi:hypothetical protein
MGTQDFKNCRLQHISPRNVAALAESCDGRLRRVRRDEPSTTLVTSTLWITRTTPPTGLPVRTCTGVCLQADARQYDGRNELDIAMSSDPHMNAATQGTPSTASATPAARMQPVTEKVLIVLCSVGMITHHIRFAC